MATALRYNDGLITIIRWVARILALLLAIMVVIFVTGEGIDLSSMSMSAMVMGVIFVFMWLGLIIALHWEGTGGMMTTVGTVLYLLLDYILTGHVLRFWVFFSFLILGLLFLYCWWQGRHGMS